MDEAALYEWIANAEKQNPGTIQRMLDAALSGDRMGIEDDTMKIGAGLWNTPRAQGQNVGQTYVAASPVEHLSNMMMKVVGAKKLNDSQAAQQGLVNQKGQGLDALIRAMARPQQPPVAPPQQQGYGAGPGGAAPPLDLQALLSQYGVVM